MTHNYNTGKNPPHWWVCRFPGNKFWIQTEQLKKLIIGLVWMVLFCVNLDKHPLGKTTCLKVKYYKYYLRGRINGKCQGSSFSSWNQKDSLAFKTSILSILTFPKILNFERSTLKHLVSKTKYKVIFARNGAHIGMSVNKPQKKFPLVKKSKDVARSVMMSAASKTTLNRKVPARSLTRWTFGWFRKYLQLLWGPEKNNNKLKRLI